MSKQALIKMLASPRLRRVATATSGTVAGNALGAALPFVVTAVFTPGATTDAYFYALGTIVYLSAAVSSAIESSASPHVIELKTAGRSALQRFVMRTALQGATAAIAIALVGCLIVTALVLPATSFTDDQRHEIFKMLLLLSPLAPLIAISAVLAGSHYGFHRFLLPTWSLALRSGLAVALTLSFHQTFGVQAVAYGLVAGEALRVGLLAFNLHKIIAVECSSCGLARLEPERRFWTTATPQVVSMSIGGVNQMVDKTVAASLAPGSITIVELAQRLVYTPILLLTSGIGLVAGSSWAELLASGTLDEVRRDFLRVLKMASAAAGLVVVVMIPLVWLARPLLSSVAEGLDVDAVALAFSLFAVGIPFALASQLGVRLLISARRTKSMPFLTAGGVIVNLALDVTLSRAFGIPGIAVASASVNTLNAIASVGLALRILKPANVSKEA